MAQSNSVRRMVAEERSASELRVPKPPEIPERVTRAFPEMRDYNAQMSEWYQKQNEAIRIALSEIQETPKDYVAIFEAELIA
jgi:hypothetical protein